MFKHHLLAFSVTVIAATKASSTARGDFFDRFGGPGGPGMKSGRVLTSEDLHLVILALISEKPSHGYEIIKSIERRSSGIYTPSPGMIYPALTYLEEASFAVSEAEGAKKLYRITEPGAEYLAKNREHVDALLARLTLWGQKISHFRDQMAEEEETDERWGGIAPGTAAQGVARNKVGTPRAPPRTQIRPLRETLGAPRGKEARPLRIKKGDPGNPRGQRLAFRFPRSSATALAQRFSKCVRIASATFSGASRGGKCPIPGSTILS